jgi:hypothetical protein
MNVLWQMQHLRIKEYNLDRVKDYTLLCDPAARRLADQERDNPPGGLDGVPQIDPTLVITPGHEQARL